MNTYRKMVYMIMDELKLMSDDASFTEDHIIYLLGKYRAFILKQRYSDAKKTIPDSNYQTICLNLQKAELYDGIPCLDLNYLESTEKVPALLPLGNTRIYPSSSYFSTDITYISKERFKFIGHNPYLRNVIYGTTGYNSKLYLQSDNTQYKYLKCVKLTGLFEDPEEAAKLECEDSTVCNILDKKFPIEEGLVTTIIQLIVQDIGHSKYTPEDNANDAADPMGALQNSNTQDNKPDNNSKSENG